MHPARRSPKVVVAGGGNAGLCAAIAAREAGAEVTLLERGALHMRGGNSRHTRDIRLAHLEADPYVAARYEVDELEADIREVTSAAGDGELTRIVAEGSLDLAEWMSARGVRWQEPLRGTLHLNRTNRFFLGGGKAMMNAYYKTADRLGVRILYGAHVKNIGVGDRAARSVEVATADGVLSLELDALVVATGGFEANIDWLREYWGAAADNFIVRGTPLNDGDMLRELYEMGASPAGDPRQFHSTAVDGRAPRFDGGVATRLDCVPFGIAVNQSAQRFYDEGQDLWSKRYAIWGGLIATQPGQVAYAINDSKSRGLYLPSLYPPIFADSISSLAGTLGLDPASLDATVAEFNNACSSESSFNPSVLDCLSTRGLDPPKSNWARRIDTPPFHAYPLRPGITFTYLGLRVDQSARVLRDSKPLLPNVFAAGELMAGNILSNGYLAGLGLAIGAVFGRIAGKEAATNALT
jgi:tricarballylate dehydrogenase